MKNTIKFANWLSKWNNWNDILTISVATSVFVIVVVFLLGLRRRFAMKQLQSKKKSEHNWHLNDLFTKPTYCNVCEYVMVSGVYCTYCNIYSDEKCLKKAEKMFKCKQMYTEGPYETSECVRKWQHQWVKGNLHLNSLCSICTEDDCGNSPSLTDFKCVWCWQTVHESCFNCVTKPSLMNECNFGKFSRIVLRPSLLVKSTGSSNAFTSLNDLKISKAFLKAPDTNWTPLFVFANLKSGNNDADLVINQMTTFLNPLQIIEMNKKNVDETLKWIETYSDCIQFKILVCGGDGSIGWILESLSKLNFKSFEPSVGILPLGTGNDLSRALMWGQGYVGEVDLEDILVEMSKAKLVKMDRWKIEFARASKETKRTSSNSSDESAKPIDNTNKQIKFMNNYFSVGCDALVTLNFHRRRNNMFFANRLINKFIYFKYGTIDTFLKECRLLSQNIELYLDGKLVELPHLESVVILNIPYWGGGVDPWNLGNTNKSRTDIATASINDGLLEVFGVYSSFHIAQMQVGLAEPFRIGQARHVCIKLSKRFPVQIDGEPWEQNPTLINISFFNQATMLQKSF